MGCSSNVLDVFVKNEEQAKAFARVFAEVNQEEMYDEGEVEDIIKYASITPAYSGFNVHIDGEPLYQYADNNENGLEAVKAFLKQYPEAELTASFYESFDNCGEINTIDCKWDKEKKILHYEEKSIELGFCEEIGEKDQYEILDETKPRKVKDIPYSKL